MHTKSEFGATSVGKAPERTNNAPVHIRFESAVIQRVNHLNQIASDPANAGRTFQVTKEVFDHFFEQIQFLPRHPEDIFRINDLLGLSLSEDEPCGMTRVCSCQHCGHEFSFADHVEASMRMGLHTAADLRKLFDGDKYFLTIDTDKKREVLCLSCGEKSWVLHCCYGSKTYAYAGGD